MLSTKKWFTKQINNINQRMCKLLRRKALLVLSKYSNYFLRGCVWVIYKSFHIPKRIPQDFYLQLFIRHLMNLKIQNCLSFILLNN